MGLSLFSKKLTSGFTLVEVMVAMFIMSVSTGLLLSNYPDSTIRLTLLNSTHDLALLTREAQIRGSAVDSASASIGGYGIFIDSATATKSILFSDSINNINSIIVKNNAGLAIGDGLFDRGYSPSDTIKKTLTLNDRFTYKKLCVASSTASEYITDPTKPFLCYSVNTVPIRTLTISFTRPSQVAHMYVNNDILNDFSAACVELYSPKSPIPGHTRSVRILHSGVITTSTKTCD